MPRASSSPEWAFRDYFIKEPTLDWPSGYTTITYLAPVLVRKIELLNMETKEVFGEIPLMSP